jgi:tetratricopeptide (TPR) repeat protein
VSSLLIGALGVMLSTNPVVAASNLVANTTGIQIGSANTSTNDPVEAEYQKLLEADDSAQETVDRWIRENQEFAAHGAAVPNAELNRRIMDRLEPVRKGYDDFLQRHPEHVPCRIAFASFLGDTGDEDGARAQLEKALPLDPKNPAIYNNLANIYGHSGPVEKAFEYYGKAIELNPREPTYYHNLGTVVYLFRKDAKEIYGIDEKGVFDKVFVLYSNAMRLDPLNFPLASDVAQTYYGVTPLRTEDALKAWTNAFSLAHDSIEQEGVQLHFARVKLLSGRFGEARAHLEAVTNSMYADMKRRLTRNLNEREEAARTNSPAADLPPAVKLEQSTESKPSSGP